VQEKKRQTKVWPAKRSLLWRQYLVAWLYFADFLGALLRAPRSQLPALESIHWFSRLICKDTTCTWARTPRPRGSFEILITLATRRRGTCQRLIRINYVALTFTFTWCKKQRLRARRGRLLKLNKLCKGARSARQCGKPEPILLRPSPVSTIHIDICNPGSARRTPHN